MLLLSLSLVQKLRAIDVRYVQSVRYLQNLKILKFLEKLVGYFFSKVNNNVFFFLIRKFRYTVQPFVLSVTREIPGEIYVKIIAKKREAFATIISRKDYRDKARKRASRSSDVRNRRDFPFESIINCWTRAPPRARLHPRPG